jgi:hypothetical protein
MRDARDLDLVIYGLVLGGLGGLAHWLAPEFGTLALVTAVGCGILCITCGLIGVDRLGRKQAASAVGLVLLAFVPQVLRAWLMVEGGAAALKRVAVIWTLLAIFGIVELINLLRETRER